MRLNPSPLSIWRRLRWRAVMGVGLALGLGAGALVQAHPAGPGSGIVHACVNNSSGTIKIIDASGQCANNEIAVDWYVNLASLAVTSVTASSPLAVTGSGAAPNVALQGVVPVANGGTGLNSGPTTAGQFLRSAGPGAWSVGAIAPGDLPNLANNYAVVTGTNATGTWPISVTGNAGTVSNGVYTNGSYQDPSWLTGLAGGKITGSVANASNAVNATTATNFSGSLAGDVTGAQGATTVGALRGRALSAATPSAGQALLFDGAQWAPGTIAAGAGGGLNGFKAFNQAGTVTWTAPAGVTKVLVELWGAGGGGGGGAGFPQDGGLSRPAGGGGGGGGYARGAVAVTPGVTYELVVGAAGAPGAGGTATGIAGGAGGATILRVQSDSTVLAAANGGAGGGAACICPPGLGAQPVPGQGGVGGDTVGVLDGVRLLGSAGAAGTVGSFVTLGAGGAGGASFHGSVFPIAGGRGGASAANNVASSPGESGQAGYAILQW